MMSLAEQSALRQLTPSVHGEGDSTSRVPLGGLQVWARAGPAAAAPRSASRIK
jgi:hypothetical protein